MIVEYSIAVFLRIRAYNTINKLLEVSSVLKPSSITNINYSTAQRKQKVYRSTPLENTTVAKLPRISIGKA
ncbi:MAG: hypothetical protein QW425_04105 [Desulfurococcaceae archaeon]